MRTTVLWLVESVMYKSTVHGPHTPSSGHPWWSRSCIGQTLGPQKDSDPLAKDAWLLTVHSVLHTQFRRYCMHMQPGRVRNSVGYFLQLGLASNKYMPIADYSRLQHHNWSLNLIIFRPQQLFLLFKHSKLIVVSTAAMLGASFCNLL